MLQRNAYGILPDKLVRNMLLMRMWSETRGNSATNMTKKRFLRKYRISRFPKASLKLLPSPPSLCKKNKSYSHVTSKSRSTKASSRNTFISMSGIQTKNCYANQLEKLRLLVFHIYIYANDISINEKKGSRSQERTRWGIAGVGLHCFHAQINIFSLHITRPIGFPAKP